MTRALAHLTGGGCSLVIAIDDEHGVPFVAHWGAGVSDDAAGDLARTAGTGVATSAPDRPRRLALVPGPGDGWAGTPGFEGHLAGRALPARFALATIEQQSDRATIGLRDEGVGVGIELRARLDAAGVLRLGASVEHLGSGPDPLDLAALRLLLPVPHRAGELLDFTGRWSRERSPQRRPLSHGTHLRRADRGRPGHDSPYLLALGSAGFGFRHGEVWAAHLAWSGSGEYLAERLPEGAGAAASALGVGERLAPGEIRLAPGERYDAPEAVFAWSDRGLDGVTERLHESIRARPQHPSTPRPITVNSWEAVYFDHDEGRIDELVRHAAEIGAERFVLDDGWFGRRDDDTTSLGDWVVDTRKWPSGLGALSRRVRDLGLQFGLWVEPEMVSLDSELARAHPDWLLAPAHRPTGEARHQQVLNVAHPDVARHLLERLSSLVDEVGIDYLKWDHNRDVVEAVDRVTGRPGVHRQTLAVYRLIDELRRAHPGLEIEACAGGGGRVDLGMLARTERIWTSDTLDPVERQAIQLWTTTLVPPELMGTHVGADRAHTTGRRTDLPFRLATALLGHAGVEWDLRECSDEELARLGAWVRLAKEFRPLVARGRVVRADLEDPDAVLSGLVEPDGSGAVYTWARLGTSADIQQGRVPFPGLRDDLRYAVRVRTELGAPRFADRVPPEWVAVAAEGGLVVAGDALTRVGLPLPTLQPAQAMIVEVRAVD